MSWFKEQYPIGQPVMAANQEDEMALGKIEAISEDGIIVEFADGSRQEIGAEFLEEDGKRNPFIRKLFS